MPCAPSTCWCQLTYAHPLTGAIWCMAHAACTRLQHVTHSNPALVRAATAGGGRAALGRVAVACAVAVATAAANRSDTPKSSNIFQNPPIDMVVATAPAVPRQLAECDVECGMPYMYV